MPPGALVSIIQKGVQYVEAEVALNEVRFALTTTGGEILVTNSKHDEIRNLKKKHQVPELFYKKAGVFLPEHGCLRGKLCNVYQTQGRVISKHLNY